LDAWIPVIDSRSLKRMHADEDAELLRRARAGDLDAFAELVRRSERRVRGLLSRFLDDPRDVDEAAQDTFVQAWRNLRRFRGHAAPSTWFYRIAVNEALQRTRRKRVETRPLEDGDLRHSSPSADTVAEQGEVRAFVAARLRALPFELRVPVVLRDVEGWSNQEIADLLELSLAATKSRIHRGRMRIREELDAWRKAAEATPPTVARRHA
jgi:RNA polymerase sigma-70 factor (ECF subfamily)